MAFFLMASAAFDGCNARPDHVRERQDDDDQKETSAAYRKSLAIGWMCKTPNGEQQHQKRYKFDHRRFHIV
jgi:hypothetical protein